MKRFKVGARETTIGRRDFIKLGAAVGAVSATTMTSLNVREASAQTAQTLSAEPWAVPQKTTVRPVSIDCHCHWAPPQYMKALLAAGDNRPYDPVNYDMDRRIKWMDMRGVQMLVLTLNGGMPWGMVKPEEGVRIAQICNDEAIDAHKTYPDRFIASIEVFAADPVLALKELNRVAGKPGMRAVHLPNSIASRDYLFEPTYVPFLARVEELGYPILFHPLDEEANYYGGKARLADHYSDVGGFSNTLGFTFETATTAAKFIVSGTLDRFPNLEIVLPHSGGCFPYIFGRVDHGLAVRKVKLQRPFKDYARRFHYDALTYDPEILRFLINFVGSDRVVIGTDNAFGANGQAIEYPHTLVEQLNLPAVDHDRILRGNAARLFHL
ncbi:MAG TPA: amidohydrolase family protein [Verrucomicrobiae bacterium]|nr:amidohydrolase family protein [Verrucomicrobiae bacterium]